MSFFINFIDLLISLVHKLGPLTLTIPVAQLRVDMSQLVSEIGILEAHSQHLEQHTNVGLVSHDRASEEWRSASWFTRLSRLDQQKYEQLVLLNRRLDSMQQSTQFLDDTFERAEVRVNIALAHLRGTNKRLTDIYVALGQSASRIEAESADDQKRMSFTELEVNQLEELFQQTRERIEVIRSQNDPILNAITVYGCGAIDAS